jgi:hypothetical protein
MRASETIMDVDQQPIQHGNYIETESTRSRGLLINTARNNENTHAVHFHRPIIYSGNVQVKWKEVACDEVQCRDLYVQFILLNDQHSYHHCSSALLRFSILYTSVCFDKPRKEIACLGVALLRNLVSTMQRYIDQTSNN